MPSQELFEAQDRAYRESVLPTTITKRVVIEAASPFGWDRYLSTGGLMIGMEGFGRSAPYKVLAEHFGFTEEGVLQRIRDTFC
jgi:transketolase